MKDMKMIVLGDIDPVSAVSKLRKCCHTELVSVGQAEENKKNEYYKKKEVWTSNYISLIIISQTQKTQRIHGKQEDVEMRIKLTTSHV